MTAASDAGAGRRRHSTWKWLLAIAALAVLITVGALIATDPADNIVLEEARVRRDPMGQRVLSGTFRNRTGDRTYDTVRVEIELLDARDSVVGTMAAQTRELAPKQSWSFTIPTPQPEVVKYRLARLHCTWNGQTHPRMCSIGVPVVVD